MSDVLFRCSSLGYLMTDPRTRAEGDLSAGARTYLRELAKQAIFSVDFEVSGKEIEKGLRVESECIDLLNRVRGLSLTKNTERKKNAWITGECDLFDAPRRRGHDIKAPWSIKTFPGWTVECVNQLYDWQMRGYMMLWDADQWEVNYVLVDTPEDLIRNEPLELHVVNHLPPEHRLTTWLVERDFQKEALIRERVEAARWYYGQLIREFDGEHRMHAVIDVPAREVPPRQALATKTTTSTHVRVQLPELF